MTQNVPTNGFIQPPGNPPPAGPGATINIPPPAAPAAPAAPAPAAPAAAPAAAASGDLSAAIAALTAALGAQGTPPAAPAVPGVPAAPAAPAAPADLNNVNVDALDDPILRSMALAMQTGAQGVDMNRAMGLAIERGDKSLIDRAYLVEKFGPDAVNRIQIAEGIVDSVNAKAEASARAAYDAAGGKDQWSAAAAAFNKAAPDALKTVIVTMLDSGKTDQVSAASKLVVEFAKGQGFIPNSNPLLNAGASLPGGQALSKAEFQAELRKLDTNSRDYQERRADLFARRTLGKQLNK